jgi:hypothetical protein
VDINIAENHLRRCINGGVLEKLLSLADEISGSVLELGLLTTSTMPLKALNLKKVPASPKL